MQQHEGERNPNFGHGSRRWFLGEAPRTVIGIAAATLPAGCIAVTQTDTLTEDKLSPEQEKFLREFSLNRLYSDSFTVGSSTINFLAIDHQLQTFEIADNKEKIITTIKNADAVILEGSQTLVPQSPLSQWLGAEHNDGGFFDNCINIALDSRKPICFADATRSGDIGVYNIPYPLLLIALSLTCADIYDKKKLVRRDAISLASRLGLLAYISYNPLVHNFKDKKEYFLELFFKNKTDQLIADMTDFRNRFLAQTIEGLAQDGIQNVAVIYGAGHYEPTKKYLLEKNGTEEALKTVTDAFWEITAYKPMYFVPENGSWEQVQRQKFIEMACEK